MIAILGYLWTPRTLEFGSSPGFAIQRLAELCFIFPPESRGSAAQLLEVGGWGMRMGITRIYKGYAGCVKWGYPKMDGL